MSLNIFDKLKIILVDVVLQIIVFIFYKYTNFRLLIVNRDKKTG